VEQNKKLDLGQEIGDGEVVVVCCENYQKDSISILKWAVKEGKKICYVTINKPYDTLIQILKKNNIDTKKFFFVDAITKTIKEASPVDNCVFVSSPNSLTEMSIAVRAACKQGFDILIFDSLSALMVYEKEEGASTFLHSLVNILRVHKVKALFEVLSVDEGSKMMKNMQMFVDKKIKI
jgi:KaiC/GvpD/RAD55 family RecA-like ATPase